MNRMKDYASKALAQIEASAEKGIWEAHTGCSVLAGALLVSQQLVERDAMLPIESLIRLKAGADRPPPAKTATLSRTIFAEKILRELAPDAQQPKEIGHDVIYSAYVLRALEVFEIDPWPSLLAGLTTLVRSVRRSGPGWITINGTNEHRPMSDAAKNVEEGYWETFVRFDRPLPMEIGDMQLGHLLTHGHAIEMLKGYAEKTLIADLDLAYRKRLQALGLANQEQLDRTPLPLRALDPRREAYWKSVDELGDMHGHVLKYAYSVLDLKKDGISPSDFQAFGRIVWPDHHIPH